jgi:uncharacterized protein DUF4158
MPRREILSPAQREELLAIPVDRAGLIEHLCSSEQDLCLIRQRRGDHNRLGIALQLALLRFPGTALLADEAPPQKLINFLSAFVVSSVLQLSPAQSASRIPKPCDRLRKIRAHARPDRATKRILLRGVARDDDHRLSPCMIYDVGLRRPSSKEPVRKGPLGL